MANLEKAFEIRDNLRYCHSQRELCALCPRNEPGCIRKLMKEAADVIEGLILEVPTEDSCEACKIGGAEDGQR